MERVHLIARLSTCCLLMGAVVTCTDAPNPLTVSDATSLDDAPLPTTAAVEEESDGVLVEDSFSRTESNGWGTPEAGDDWNESAPEDFRVDGSRGLIVKGDNSPRNVVASSGYGLNVAGLVSFSIDTPPDHPNRYYTIHVYARRDDRVTDGDNYYRYRVRAFGDGRMDVEVEKNVNASLSLLVDDTPIAATWAPGRTYWIRWECIGTSPSTALRMRVWQDGTAEPSTWDVDVTVNEPALDVTGTTGFRVAGPNGDEQVSFPVTFALDDLKYREITDQTDPGEPNQAPVADAGGAYSGTVGTAIQFDGSGSSDPDGDTPLSYAWDFGDGGTGTGATPSHVYAAAGEYTVVLTVTDTVGASSSPDTTTATVATPPNQAPVADAGGPYAGTTGSAISFDGSASSDPDGDLPLTYAWDFGDGNTSTGVTPSHTYAAAGTYTVTLIVTDSEGAASIPSTTTADVQAASTSTVLVKDSFSRTVSGGWGTAEAGGLWRISSGDPSIFRVNGSEGQIVAPDNSPRNAVATEGYELNVAGLVSFSIDTPSDHPSRFYTVQVYALRNDRVTDGDNYYRYRVRAYGHGKMDVRVEKNVNGVLTWLGDARRIAPTWAPGQKYWIRWECIGTSPSTALRMRVWQDGTAEPTTWDVDVTVNEPALDFSGTTGFRVAGPNGDEQVSFPITFTFDDLEYGVK